MEDIKTGAMLHNFRDKMRQQQCMAVSESLQQGFEKPLYETIKVKHKM